MGMRMYCRLKKTFPAHTVGKGSTKGTKNIVDSGHFLVAGY